MKKTEKIIRKVCPHNRPIYKRTGSKDHRHYPSLLNLHFYRCRGLRKAGYSFGEISSVTGLSKSTVHFHTQDIELSAIQIKNIEIRRKEKNKNRINPRKGKCLAGREVITPKQWSSDLVHIVAHFMFDGRIDEDGCIYYSKDKYQIAHMQKLLRRIFRAKPKIQLRDNGVYGLVFYQVEMADYLKRRKEELLPYLNNGAPNTHKKQFLRAFFDDEGCVFYKGHTRRVRGYQQSEVILKQIISLLNKFGVNSKIDKKAKGVEISGKKNLQRFAKEINFAPKIYINPNRKNGVWKEKISKRDILDLALRSYVN